jgi:hypothetical protein
MRCAATAATNARRRAITSVCGVKLLAYEAYEALSYTSVSVRELNGVVARTTATESRTKKRALFF